MLYYKDFLIIFLFFKNIHGKTENRIFSPAVNPLAKNWKPPKPNNVHTV